MKKFCVFCGEAPSSKSMEHVIPQWLIKLTGDPLRKINLGIDPAKAGYPQRMYSFNKFRFPSCKDCNSKFGSLEARAKPIVEDILNDNPLSASDFDTFLDWIDKVRIGLWLAFYCLDKNVSCIKPNYHIDFRVGIYDRMCAIYKANDEQEGISFIGVSTPAFQYHPTCFTLVINKYYFFNLSTTLLFARRLGFPYSADQTCDPDSGGIFVNFRQGKYRTMYPLVRKAIFGGCKQIYQPMFGGKGINEEIKEKYYNFEYIKRNSMDWDNGIGCVYLQENGKIKTYSSEKNKLWIPKNGMDRDIVKHNLMMQTLDFQLTMLNSGPSMDLLGKEQLKIVDKQFGFAKKFNNIFLKKNTKKNRFQKT